MTSNVLCPSARLGCPIQGDCCSSPLSKDIRWSIQYYFPELCTTKIHPYLYKCIQNTHNCLIATRSIIAVLDGVIWRREINLWKHDGPENWALFMFQIPNLHSRKKWCFNCMVLAVILTFLTLPLVGIPDCNTESHVLKW